MQVCIIYIMKIKLLLLVSSNSETKTFGVNIRNDVEWSLLKFQVSADYENHKTSYNYFNNIDKNNFSISGVLSAYLNDSTFIPSIFYKTSSSKINSTSTLENIDYYNKSKDGFGFDMIFRLKSNLAFYFGGSILDGNYSSDDNILLMELGAKFQTTFLQMNLNYFINEYSNQFYTGGVFFNSYQFGNLKGFGANLNLNYWKLILESKSSYYSQETNTLIGVPEFQTQTGLYFKDILFNSNLDLKTGFVFYYTGKNNVFTNEHGVLEVPSSNKLDFTLAGEIQKTAIIYFLWQNLLGNNYYITPYYPMPSRSIRFGVAWEMFN